MLLKKSNLRKAKYKKNEHNCRPQTAGSKKIKKQIGNQIGDLGNVYRRAGDLGNVPRTTANAPESKQIQSAWERKTKRAKLTTSPLRAHHAPPPTSARYAPTTRAHYAPTARLSESASQDRKVRESASQDRKQGR